MTNNPTTKIINHLNFLIESTTYSSAYLRALPVPHSIIHKFCIGLFDRMRTSCLNLDTFFKDEHFELKYEFVAGIITRSILLDSLIVFNLEADVLKLQKEGKTKPNIENFINEYCYTILSDGLNHTLYFIKTAKDLGIVGKEYQLEFYFNMSEIYSDFIEPYNPANDDIPRLKYSKNNNAINIFKKISEVDFFKKRISSLYDSYQYFSKYEHYGILYHTTSTIDINNKLETYLEVIESFVVAHTFLLDILNEYYQNDPFIQRLKAKSHLYISENLQ